MSKLFAIAAFIVLTLNVYNVYVISGIRSARIESQQQQVLLNQGLRVRQINNQFINTLASVSVRTGDKDLRSILASEGVTFTINTAASTDNSPTESVDGDKK